MTSIEPIARKRLIISIGGRSGVGKTSVMTGLAEWYDAHEIPVTLLDLDTEKETRSGLSHFFGGHLPKIDIHTPEGLNTFLESLKSGRPIVLADTGSRAGRVAHAWFDQVYASVAQRGLVFTAVGVITSDPASVESVLAWAGRLQRRVAYVIVENETDSSVIFTYWRESAQALAFQQTLQPAVIHMEYRLPHLETAMRNHGVTLSQVARRQTGVPELQLSKAVIRAEGHRLRLFAQFETVKDLLLP